MRRKEIGDSDKHSGKRQKLIEQIDKGLEEDRTTKIGIFLKILEDIYNCPDESRDIKKQRSAIRKALRYHSLGFLDLEHITPGMVDALIDKLSAKTTSFGVDPIKELLKATVRTINRGYKKLNPADSKHRLLNRSYIMWMYDVDLDDDLKIPFFRRAETKYDLIDIEMHKHNTNLIKKRFAELAKRNAAETNIHPEQDEPDPIPQEVDPKPNSENMEDMLEDQEMISSDEEDLSDPMAGFVMLAGTKPALLSLDPIENLVRYYKALLDKTSSRNVQFAIDQLQGSMLLNIIRYAQENDNRASREKIIRCITSYFCILQAKVITKLICEGNESKARWFILRHQFDVTSNSEPLKAAIKQNNVEMVRFLLNHGAGITKWDLDDFFTAQDDIMRLLQTSFPNAFEFDYESDLFSMPRKALATSPNIVALRESPRDKITRYIWANTILQNNIDEFAAQYLSMLWYQFTSPAEHPSKLCRVNVAQSPELLKSLEYEGKGCLKYNVKYDGDMFIYIENLLSQYTQSKYKDSLALKLSVVQHTKLLNTYSVTLRSTKPEIQSLIECLELRENRVSSIKISKSLIVINGIVEPFIDEAHIDMRPM